MYTMEFGRMSMVTSSSKRGHNKGKINMFQPLSIIEVELDLKPTISMQKIKGARIAYPYASIPFDPYKISIGLFLSEFLVYALRDEQRAPLLYEYIEHSMIWLDTAVRDFSNFHLVFAIRLSQFIGIHPNVEGYGNGCFFDLREGRFTSLIPSHPDFLKHNEALTTITFLRLNYNNMHLMKLNRIERNRCANVILKYYRLHIPNFPELKSFEVMQELFS